jgi:hypothetical protein
MESKLRKEYIVYYLDRHFPFMGELAIATRANEVAYFIKNDKVVKTRAARVIPYEMKLEVKVKRGDDLEKTYQRAQDKMATLENRLYTKLKPFGGKGKLFIRDERVQSEGRDTFVFTEVICIAKGVR